MKYFKYFIPPNLFICINKWSNWRYDPFAGCEIKVLKKICQINGEKMWERTWNWWIHLFNQHCWGISVSQLSQWHCGYRDEKNRSQFSLPYSLCIFRGKDTNLLQARNIYPTTPSIMYSGLNLLVSLCMHEVVG